MVALRSGRLEEKRQKRRLTVAIAGMLGIVVFFAFFGVKILVGFSLLVDRLRGSTPAQQITQSLLLPPILDPLPTATNSATLNITGFGTDGTDVIIYVNEKEEEKVTVEKNGTFETLLSSLSEGSNTISSRATDGKGNVSDPSNVLTVLIKKKPPILELTAPADNASVTGDNNKILVSGKTEENASITINSRVVVVKGDYTFTYDFPLNEGENKLNIVATDLAGNTTTIERKATYHR